MKYLGFQVDESRALHSLTGRGTMRQSFLFHCIVSWFCQEQTTCIWTWGKLWRWSGIWRKLRRSKYLKYEGYASPSSPINFKIDIAPGTLAYVTTSIDSLVPQKKGWKPWSIFMPILSMMASKILTMTGETWIVEHPYAPEVLENLASSSSSSRDRSQIQLRRTMYEVFYFCPWSARFLKFSSGVRIFF